MRSCFCIDLKSFYASAECVERHLDPMTADLVVADPDRGQGTICLAVSVHMKAQGVKNRCRVFEIPKNLHYIMAKPRMHLYIEYAARIYGIYLKYIAKEDIHVYSVDEAFFEAGSYIHMYGNDVRILSKMLQDEILSELGLYTTCGMGTNLYLAKIAMDILAKHSPDRRAYLSEEEYCTKLGSHKPLSDFWMIGHGTERRLNSIGIFTMEDIRNTDSKALEALIGRNSSFLIDHAYGRDDVTIADIKDYESPMHSLSSNQVLLRDYSFDEGKLVLKEMVDLLSLDLVDEGLVTDGVTLYVAYSKDYPPALSIEKKLPSATSSVRILTNDLLALYMPYVNRDYAIRRIGISFLHVIPDSLRQYNLFRDSAIEDKDLPAMRSANLIRHTYGNNAILKGMNLLPAGTTIARNSQIGGHHA